MELTKACLAVCKMDTPNKCDVPRGISDSYFSNGMKFSIILLFVFENPEPCRLGFDPSVRHFELRLRVRQWLDVCRYFWKFRAYKVELLTCIAPQRIADPRDPDSRTNFVLAFSHDASSLFRQNQETSRSTNPDILEHVEKKSHGKRHNGGFGSVTWPVIGS